MGIGQRAPIAPHRALLLNSPMSAGVSAPQEGVAPPLSLELPRRPQQATTPAWGTGGFRMPALSGQGGAGDVSSFMSPGGLVLPSQLLANPQRAAALGGERGGRPSLAGRLGGQPGANLSRHLLGQSTGRPGRGGMALGSYDRLGVARGGESGALSPGGWRGLAAHELSRPTA
ncbi:MAG: hypothetical protein JKY65_02830, partial [Planctomycetes bacterium]|nr:hypothetical protein [Planctomycetota bacterium]